ncbi:MAG TPA: response regulator transcription factor [Acidimicrobiales bacterium]|jgi:DNA-binding NarL/FixJ family response regulator|nr:response regulator transcription factor [Acidimicrobiales bacterium]
MNLSRGTAAEKLVVESVTRDLGIQDFSGIGDSGAAVAGPERCAVFVYAGDPVSQYGMAALLRGCSALSVVDDVDHCRVAVLVADDVDTETARVIGALQRDGVPRVVLVVARIDDAGLMRAVEAGVSGIVHRDDADPAHLVRAINEACSGGASLPGDVAGRLMAQIGALHRRVLSPRGLNMQGLSEREVGVLSLLAEGFDTAEVADKMCYSERTVKGVLQGVTRRYQLRNRTHAVVFALRHGLI